MLKINSFKCRDVCSNKLEFIRWNGYNVVWDFPSYFISNYNTIHPKLYFKVRNGVIYSTHENAVAVLKENMQHCVVQGVVYGEA